MRRKIISAIFCILFIVFGNGVAVTIAAENGSEPDIKAKGAVLMEFDTGRVLYEKNADELLANASTTKIMTAIVALERCGLSDVVTASKKAAGTPPVKMYLEVGEKQTLQDLLYALMLESANDAAVAIAEHVGGTVEGFADMMNTKAKELGANNTIFVTPNGLDEGDHHTTARDLAIISRYALANKDFQKIISTKAITTPVNGGDFKQHSFVNKDRLLSEFDGALGVKTGYTGKAGHCFVGAAKRDGMMIISVVLGSGWGNVGKEQKWVDTKQLLNYGFNNYKYVKIVQKDTPVKTFDVLHSKRNTVLLKLNSGLSMPLKTEEMREVEMRYSLPVELDAPIEKGQKLGYADVYVSGKKLAVIDIMADKDVERHDFNIYMGKILDNLLNISVDDLVRIAE